MEKIVVELVTVPRLSDPEVIKAFDITEDTLIWKALMQILGDYREDSCRNAAAMSVQGNTYGAATYLGSWEAADSLRSEILRLRSEAQKQK